MKILIAAFLLIPLISLSQDTTYSTYNVQHDTIITAIIPEQYICRDTTYQVFDTSYRAYYQYQVYATVEGSIMATYQICDTIPAHDSTFICSMCASHDTTVMVITPDEIVMNGMLPALSGQSTQQKVNYVLSYSCNAIRSSFDAQRTGNGWPTEEAHNAGLYSIVTYNSAPTAHPPIDAFPTAAELPAQVAYLDSLLGAHEDDLPDQINIQNEEPNTNYWSGPVSDYVNWMNAAAEVCHKYNVPVSNGGLLQNIVYYMRWVYQQEGKTDSVNIINQRANLGPNTGTAAQFFIDWYKVEIPAIAASTLTYVCQHWYEPSLRNDPNRTTSSGLLPLVIQFLRSRTGKPVIITEFGTDNPSENLFNQLADEIDASGVKCRVYYSGDGNVAENHPQYWEDWINQNSP